MSKVVKPIEVKIVEEDDKNKSIGYRLPFIVNYSLLYYILNFIQEVSEAFIIVIMYKYIISSSKDINIGQALKIAILIGLFTLFLEEYNSKYKDNIKSGMIVSIGTQFVKS